MRSLIAAALLALPIATHAGGVPHSYSAQFDGTCIDGDMWNQWKVSGSPDFLVRPWSAEPISVIGYELVEMSHYPKKRRWWRRVLDWFDDARYSPTWYMVGSTIQSDAMIWLAPGETHREKMWPAGMSQPFPSKSEAVPVAYLRNGKGDIYAASGQLLDLHGHCPVGDVVSVMLTIYYVPAARLEEHAAR